LAERYKKKIGKEMKDHFIDSALPNDTYTEEEFQKNIEEVRKLTEELFKR